MITGVHTIVNAAKPERARAFFRDVLGLAHVDAGDGWLIFALPPGELGVHPTAPATSGTQELYLLCDDIEATVADLTSRGVEFTDAVSDEGWGLVTSLIVPGAGEIGLYQPRHATAV